MRPERFRRLREVLARRQPDLTVVMDGVHKPHNFSAILRSCDAAGVLDVHVVAERPGLDIHHGVSAGTRKWIGIRTHRDISDAVAHLKERGLRVVAAHPDPSAGDFRDVDYTAPTALLMGAELRGVSSEGLRLADECVTIPMTGMVHSLNVSVATALILFEAQRQRTAAGLYDRSRLPAAEFESRLFEWAHPILARRLRARGRPYPPLSPDGEVLRDRASAAQAERPSSKRIDSSTPS